MKICKYTSLYYYKMVFVLFYKITCLRDRTYYNVLNKDSHFFQENLIQRNCSNTSTVTVII